MTEEQVTPSHVGKNDLIAIAVIVEFVLILGLGALLYIKEFAPSAGGQQDSLMIVEANEFRLVDQRDSTRAALLVDQNGPRLRLFDDEGTNRAALVLNDGNPSLILLDSSESVRCVIGLDLLGNPSIVGYNPDSSTTFSLNTLYGSSSLSLFDGIGNPKASLGWAGLNLYDSGGSSRLRAQVYYDTPSLEIASPEGLLCANLSISDEGPFFAVFDDNENPRVAMTVVSDGACVSLFNSSGVEQATLGAGSTTSGGTVTNYTEGSLRLFDSRGQGTIILPFSN